MRISDWSSDVCSSDLREEFEPLRPREEIGEPEQEKIPDGVGEEFGGDEIPGLALAQRLPPAERRPRGVLAILFDIDALGRGQARMVGGRAIGAEPGGAQDEAEQPADAKGGAPAESRRNREADPRGGQPRT